MNVRAKNTEIANISDELTSKQSSAKLLLNAAAELFTNRGYDAVSTRDIAEQAGVNLALIQYHFGSKAKLFLATVDHLTDAKSDLLEKLRPIPEVASVQEGAIEIGYFIDSFLTFLLQSTQAKNSCRLIYRELFSGSSDDTELFEAVVGFIVERHSYPMELRITSLLKFIRPEASSCELTAITRSILGQCSFYVTHRPLISKLDAEPLGTFESCNRLSRHIAEFSLRGAGCSEVIVQNSLKTVFKD